MTSYKNILAVGAHPDDIELGCSGALMKFMEQGANVDIVIALSTCMTHHIPVEYVALRIARPISVHTARSCGS